MDGSCGSAAQAEEVEQAAYDPPPRPVRPVDDGAEPLLRGVVLCFEPEHDTRGCGGRLTGALPRALASSVEETVSAAVAASPARAPPQGWPPRSLAVSLRLINALSCSPVGFLFLPDAPLPAEARQGSLGLPLVEGPREAIAQVSGFPL